jgi:hypothetical protein
MVYSDPEKARNHRKQYYRKNREILLAYRAKYYQENRATILASAQKKYAEDSEYRIDLLSGWRTPSYRDKANARQRKRWKNDPEFRQKRLERQKAQRFTDPNFKEKKRTYELRKRYGMTYEEYKNMLKNQNNRCAICGALSEDLHVDHCHETGLVRALLCETCNLGLGCLRDRADILYKAFIYVNSFSK